MNFDSSVLQVAIEDIIPNRFQPRLAFEDKSLQELSDSIKQHGIIQPLVLRRIGDKYEIIAGERRYKAATMAGLASVPAVVSQIDDKTSAEVAVVENIQRKDLSAIEEAKSYKALLDQGYMSQEQLAKKMGISQSAISNKLRLLTLPKEVQDAVMDNKISERHARSILAIKDQDAQIEVVDRIIKERLTVRQLDSIIKLEYNTTAPKINIDAIKNSAVDIKPTQVVSPADDIPKEDPFKMGAINLGQRTQNKFFNTLEDEAANMQMTEAINPFNNFSSVSSSLEATTSVDTHFNKAEKIDEKPVVEFSSSAEQVLGIPTAKVSTEDNKSSEIETDTSSLVLPSDMPKIASPKLETESTSFTSTSPSVFDLLKPEKREEKLELLLDTSQKSSQEVPSASIITPAITNDINDSIDTLESLDFEPPKPVKDITLAVDKLNNTINEIRGENFKIESVKTYLIDQVTFTITIKKED